MRKKVYGYGEFSIGEVARMLGLTANTLRNWDAEGKLTAKRKPSGQRYYTRGQLEEFLERNPNYRYRRF